MAKLAGMAEGNSPDAVVFDLEDGVAGADLPDARRRVAALTAAGSPKTRLPSVVAVRVHAAAHPAFAEDLEAVGQRVTTLLLPKVAAADELRLAADRLAELGLPHVGIVAIIESAVGLENVSSIAGSLPRSGPLAAGNRSAGSPALQGVAFGAEDFAADLGLPPWTSADAGGEQGGAQDGRLTVLDAARARIVTAAAAAGVEWRVDTPTLRLGDDELVEVEARRSRGMGFSGKFAIHPSQLEPLHRGFEPSAREVAWARTVLGAGSTLDGDDETRRRGGASVVREQMVDEAVFKQARAVLAARRAADQPGG